MISREEYLKAKSIVEEYEEQEWEDKQRQADWALEEDDPFEDAENDDLDDDLCDFCGNTNHRHAAGCIYNDPLAFNEVGYG